jgi:hypothetical protein
LSDLFRGIGQRRLGDFSDILKPIGLPRITPLLYHSSNHGVVIG